MIAAEWSTRSASDLLADLSTVRSLGHLSESERRAVVDYFFEGMERPLNEKRTMKRVHRYFVWTYEALEVAYAHFGASCEICRTVSQVQEGRGRKLADRALDNLDGRVRLILCDDCSRHFAHFSLRYFDREVRVPYTDELEKMMVAWIAFEVRQKARRVIRELTENGHARNTPERRDENNRFVSAGRDSSIHPKDRGGVEEHHHEIQKGGGRGQDALPLRSAAFAPGLVLGTLPKVATPTGIHAALAQFASAD